MTADEKKRLGRIVQHNMLSIFPDEQTNFLLSIIAKREEEIKKLKENSQKIRSIFKNVDEVERLKEDFRVMRDLAYEYQGSFLSSGEQLSADEKYELIDTEFKRRRGRG